MILEMPLIGQVLKKMPISRKIVEGRWMVPWKWK